MKGKLRMHILINHHQELNTIWRHLNTGLVEVIFGSELLIVYPHTATGSLQKNNYILFTDIHGCMASSCLTACHDAT